ncbi:MAG: TolC family protein [Sulfurimonas sp.]
MRKIIGSILLTVSIVEAQELFTAAKISEYLDEKNPFVQTLYNQEYLAKEQINYQKSPFDTRLTAKLDKKEYPASTGEYSDLLVKKSFYNGIELATGYRKATGTQEYNNIKTGDQGEMLLSMKLPVVKLLAGTNTQKMNLDIAVVESTKYQFGSRNNLRLLYLEVLSSYYTLLYNKLVLKFDQDLLQKALKREEFVKERIKNGDLAEIALVELRQQIISRRQSVTASTREYNNSLYTFVKYLNISKEEFQERYTLAEHLSVSGETITLSEALQTAISKRPDLKMLEYDAKKVHLQTKNAKILKYPNVNLTLYGVHDFNYDNGFKVAFDFSFPIERNRYNAQIAKNRQTLQNIDLLKQKKILEIKTVLSKIVNSLKLLKQNLDNVEQEVLLVQKLEDAEKTKYKHGQSSLFLLNQREIATLEVQKRVLAYQINYLLLEEQLRRETGEYNF